MHLDLSEKQIEKLKSFSQAVIQRNKQHNLTGHKDPKSFFRQSNYRLHFGAEYMQKSPTEKHS